MLSSLLEAGQILALSASLCGKFHHVLNFKAAIFQGKTTYVLTVLRLRRFYVGQGASGRRNKSHRSGSSRSSPRGDSQVNIMGMIVEVVEKHQ